LLRFDGYRTTTFGNKPGDANSLPSDEVSALVEDRGGRLWVGTRNGLARFEPETSGFTVFTPPPDPSGRENSHLIRDMASDGRNGLWLATRGGLQHFDLATGGFRIFRHNPQRSDSLIRDNVSVLAPDARGGLWVATWPSGLHYLPADGGAFQRFDMASVRTGDSLGVNVRAMLVDRQQTLWIGTDYGIVRLKAGMNWEEREVVAPPAGTGKFRVMRFYEDAGGTLWVATLEEGLLRWDAENGHFQAFRYSRDDFSSLPANSLSAVLVDRSSTLWVTTVFGVIARSDLAIRGIARIFPQRSEGEGYYSGQWVFGFAQGEEGLIWVAGFGGVSLIDPRDGRVVRRLRGDSRHPGRPPNNLYAYHLHRAANGRLWIATGFGLYRLDPGKAQPVYIGFGEAAWNSINRIAEDGAGFLWLATGGGLLRYDPASGESKRYVHSPADRDGRSFSVAISVLVDRAGRVWVGGGREMPNGGVDVLDPVAGKFVNYRNQPDRGDSIAANQITSLNEDGEGNVWIGTAHGLSRAVAQPDGSFKFVNYRGFESDHVTSAIAIDAGETWVSTIVGLSRLDPRSGRIVNYTLSDGIGDPGRVEGTAFRGADGRIYFGGFTGITAVTPQQVEHNRIVPVVAFTDIAVMNRSLRLQPRGENVRLEGTVTEPKALSVSWKDSVLSFEFAALHFADPGRNRYRYRLRGFDKEWVEVGGDRRLVTYTNLDPGNYAFEVKAASKNGVWSVRPLELPVSVLPPFWKTWWFLTLLVIGLLGGAILAYRLRIRQLTQTQEHLEKLVEERTAMLAERERSKTRFLASASHDLRQPIQAINLFLSALRHSVLKADQINLVQHIEVSIKSLKGLLDSLLDVSKLDAGAIVPNLRPISLQRLLAEIDFEQSPLALDKNLRFKLAFPQKDLNLHTDPQLIKVVLQNLVMNAIKYTERGGILVGARRRGECMAIQIWDTGIGIADAERARIFEEFYQVGNPSRNRQKGLGLGLAIVKRTLPLISCELRCESRPGRGSMFEVRVPLSKEQVERRDPVSPIADERQFFGRRFALIEDDEAAAAALVAWVKSLGGEVLLYHGAEAALSDRACVREADYVISDYRLPGDLNGIDLLNAIRHDGDFRGALVTGDTSPEFIDKVRASGWPVLFKPIDPAQLLQALADGGKRNA